MGISLSQARLLVRESKRRPFTGSVLQLGKQNVGFSELAMRKVANEEKYNLSMDCVNILQNQVIDGSDLDDIRFFNLLGFTSIDSLDIDAFEGASIIHDMNVPVSTELMTLGKFDLVFDGGTMEHVFHTPNFLANCCNLVKNNGRIIHAVPIDLFNHGFHNFSSTLLEDFYSANNFSINYVLVIRKSYFNSSQWSSCIVADRDSQFIRSLHGGIFDGANHLLFVVVTKSIDSTSDKIPMQGYYVNLRSNKKDLNNAGLVSGDSPFKSFYQKLLKFPIVGRLAFSCRNFYARALLKWERI